MFLIERFGSLRNLWEGEREKIIKYIEKEMNSICDTEIFMSGVLNYSTLHALSGQFHEERSIL